MAAASDPSSLGNVLMELGYVTQEELDRVLDLQTTLDSLMGSLLLSEGVISEKQLRQATEIQQGLRSKSKYDRAMAAAGVAELTNARVIDLTSAVGEKVAHVRAVCANRRK